MKQYPFRYPDELQKELDYLDVLNGYGQSKNKKLQACVVIAAASVKKILYGHSKKEDYEKRQLVSKELKISIPY